MTFMGILIGESPKCAKATVGKGWLMMMVSPGNLLDDIMGLLLYEEAENIIYIDVHLRDWFSGEFFTVKHKIVPWEVPEINELKEVLTRKIEHMYHELINYGSNAQYRHEHMQIDIVKKMVAKEEGYYDEIKNYFDS